MKKTRRLTVFLLFVIVILLFAVVVLFAKGTDLVNAAIEAAKPQYQAQSVQLQQQVDALQKELDAQKTLYTEQMEQLKAELNGESAQAEQQRITDLQQMQAMHPIKSNASDWRPATDKVAYLTFDDGPSVHTQKILDILAEKDVKATWFVVGANKDTELKAIHDAGHTIGLHTYSHDYAYVYANEDNFYKDLKKIEQHVFDVTGVHSRIMRFPGGLSNGVSKQYSTGIMRRLATGVLQHGYTFFDWNAANNDAVSGALPSKEELLYNVKNTTGNQQCVCILMHDSKSRTTTPEALPEIIDWLREQGYRFDVLTPDLPYLAHNIKN